MQMLSSNIFSWNLISAQRRDLICVCHTKCYSMTEAIQKKTFGRTLIVQFHKLTNQTVSCSPI